MTDQHKKPVFHATIRPPYTMWVAAPSEEAVMKVLRDVELKDLEEQIPDVIDWEGTQLQVLPEEQNEYAGERPEIEVLRTLTVRFEDPTQSDLGVAYIFPKTGYRYWNTAYGLAAFQRWKDGTAEPIYQRMPEPDIYLGQYLDRKGHEEYDLYYVPQRDEGCTTYHLYARFGDASWCYHTGVKQPMHPAIQEAARRAMEHEERLAGMLESNAPTITTPQEETR